MRQDTSADQNQNTAIGPTALVVDNDPAIRKLAAAMLRGIGYRVQAVDEGTQALFEFHREPYDLVLTGYEIPAINGYQLGRRLKTQRPATRVLIMTGLCQAAVARLTTDVQIDGWLFKPFHLEELKERLSLLGLPTDKAAISQPAA